MALPRHAAIRSGWRVLSVVLMASALLVAGVSAAAAEGARILGLRHFSGPEHTRIVLDLDRACSFEVRRVEAPDRIAVNLPGAVFAGGGDRQVGDGLIERIRCNVGEDRAQLVVDLSGRREFRAFSLPPGEGKPHRIVIDILRPGGAAPPVVETPAPAGPLAAGGSAAELQPGTESVARPEPLLPAGSPGDLLPSSPAAGVQAAAAARVVPLVDGEGLPVADNSGAPATGTTVMAADGAGRSAQGDTGGAVMLGDGSRDEPAGVDPADSNAAAGRSIGTARTVAEGSEPTPDPAAGADEPFVVIIDPGHGGNDPGAIRGALEEKDIVLEIAREVARQLEKLPGWQPVLTRDRDRFVALGRRVEIARQKKGDVFVSIHCNTHPRPAVSGMEVYFLTLQGATDREARELADKENAAGLVGLPPDQEHADLVVDILMDLKMTRVLQDSGRLAAAVLTAADRSGVVAGRRVKQAGFQVLKNLAMPSALVEVAYLSNPEDYKLLKDAAGRRRLAAAIVAGLQDWRAGTAPARERPAVPVVASRGGDDRWETVYRVRSGDSLWKLADRYGTTMNEIARRNKLSERQRELRIGQRLRLPARGARP